MIIVSPEEPQDAAAIETLLDNAFGADRRCKISYRYRADVAPLGQLCLVARNAGGLVGTIRAWPVAIGASPCRAMLLGPVAIEAAARGQGIGGRLIGTQLDLAATEGYGFAVLVGDEAYYGRFGFRAAARWGIAMPGERPERVLGRALGSSMIPAGALQCCPEAPRSALA